MDFFAAFYGFSGYEAISKECSITKRNTKYNTILASISNSMLWNPYDSRVKKDYYLFQFALFTTHCEFVSNESIACLFAGSLC